MSEFKVGKLTVPYSLTRSPVASRLHIELTTDGMKVTAPNGADKEAIQGALYRKRRWIVENHADLQAKYDEMHKVARFRTGAKVPYWGRMTRLTTVVGSTQGVEYRNGLHVSLPAQPSAKLHDDYVETTLQTWMRNTLADEAGRISRRYAEKLRVQVSGQRITRMRTRWGSCGMNGIVSLDWHLVFGPKRVLEYVIVHELAHLVERNHDEAFWRTVRSAFGDYEHEHQWLIKNEHLLGYIRIPVLYEESESERDNAGFDAAAVRTCGTSD